MRRFALILLGLTLLGASAQAAPQVFNVNINTGSLVPGTPAYLDFNFASASDLSDAGTLSILGFNTDAGLGTSSVLFGTATGTLPGTVVMDNLPAGGSYYSHELTLGTYISFALLLDGALVNGPTGGLDGTTIAVTLLSTTLDPLLSSGPLFTVDIDGQGGIILSMLTEEATVEGPLEIPEPASYVLFGAGLAAVTAMRRRSI